MARDLTPTVKKDGAYIGDSSALALRTALCSRAAARSTRPNSRPRDRHRRTARTGPPL